MSVQWPGRHPHPLDQADLATARVRAGPPPAGTAPTDQPEVKASLRTTVTGRRAETATTAPPSAPAESWRATAPEAPVVHTVRERAGGRRR